MTATFRDLGVDDALCDALEAKGITHPFPIQAMTLPMALTGADLIGQARTGTGKTLAFGLPLLQRIDPAVRKTQALIVVPTRELCVQVHDDLSIGSALGITSVAVYGGTPYEEQTAALEGGVHVIVGTPGRLLDHLNRGSLDLSAVGALVLDEADEMLDMGFLPDVERLIEQCPTNRHTMLFSATMPTAIVRMARRYMVSPTFTRADLTEGETAPNVEQHFMQVHRMDKPRLLARLLQTPDRGNVYVFVRTKHMADRLVEELGELGAEAIAIHGDLRQTTRERNLDRFREGKVSVLVATEVAARGLDVDNVTHVVNYDCPEDEKMYLHRIGRTARAGRAGVAVTFVEHNEVERANLIRRAIDRTDLEVVATFSTSPELVELFDLPAEVPWARSVARRRGDGDDDAAGRGGRGGTNGKRGESREKGRRSERSARSAGRGRDEQRERDASTDASAAPEGEQRPERRRERQRRDARPRVEQDHDASTAASTTTAPPSEPAAEQDAPRPRRRRGGRGRGTRNGAEGSGQTSAPAEPAAASEAPPAPAEAPRARAAREPSGARRRGGRGRSASTSRGSDSAGGRASNEPTQRDTTSRGDGQPQLARQVKVEHLP